MLNRTNLNKMAAKMQAILLLGIVLLCGSSCERKQLYLRVDQTNIKVEITDINLEILWGITWETKWSYEWNEDLSSFGMIGYTKPELIKGIMYNVDAQSGRRFSSFTKIFGSNGGDLSLNAGSTYDMLFYNFGTEWISFYQSDDYEYYTASTRVSSQSSWTRTRAEAESSEMPDSAKTYVDYNQPDEFFGTMIKDLQVAEDPSQYEKIYNEDGTVTYVYKVGAPLRPYTFIYMYQLVILNNADEQGNRVTGARGATVTGLSQGVELFTRRTFNNTVSITTEDIKPMQKHYNVELKDGAVADSAHIMATRVLTWGLPGINPLESTKAGTRATEIDDNYIGIGLTLRNGYTYTVTRNITDEMHDLPTGGIITIYIDANDIPKDALEKKNQQTGGGFNASVEDWANEINAEITI